MNLELVVAAKKPVADGVVLLDLRPRGCLSLPQWQPGAHIDLVLGNGLVRQYSLCGDPADRSRYLLAVLREPRGRGGSRHVHDRLAAGDMVEVGGPRNHFPLVAAERYLFLAGGIGITPLLPMVAAADARGAAWRLVYGGRTRAAMAFHADLANRFPGRVVVCPQDETGLLDLEAELSTPRPGTVVYCCGPEPMLAAVERACAGWPPGALHVERFAPKPHGGTAEAFEVELAGSGRVLSVPADRTVLQVLEAAGVLVLSSCEEGTCGTCETGVLEGVPDHRDSVLTDAERAEGRSLMVCVSRSRTPRLVLDL
ncbi:ferredoxin-NADP reductase [Saccharomonospora amisosensis]|uniref:Ferredoxin-NADP reductase n=1 Tax=Saccharomonospora amisosensis TaxID=1128677 RepID=A0A7X5ZQJ5_9PSEU|nr:PDR/VanB family oxidoreductase [Saccharomonospora amisosensis]NIJ11903.1 ferredoxin-NADP reductase [Saccharomonospora amisosensis]